MVNEKRNDYTNLILDKVPILDVRAPIEFFDGSIPSSVNFPILDNQQRAQVGTIYKQQGKEAAIELGYQLVSGKVREERIGQWLEFIKGEPQTVITCFRGGLRSQTTQKWLAECGVLVPRIEGGYKRFRQFFLETIDTYPDLRGWLVISGPTGSGKSLLLRQMQNKYPILDLENLAKHKGSAFGAYEEGQPAQSDFENQLAVELIHQHAKFATEVPLLTEDESRMIGSRPQPLKTFDKIRSSEVIWIDDPINERVERTVEEYVNEPIRKHKDVEFIFSRLKKSLFAIQKRLGGARYQEVLNLLSDSEQDWNQQGSSEKDRQWVEKLFEYYYDPLYIGSLEKRQVKVGFRGTFAECLQYLKGR